MFNVGGGELLVILLIALIVLGPQRLPDAARQIGKTLGELRRMSTSFQDEMKSALDTVDDPSRVAPRRNVLAKDTPEITAAVDIDPVEAEPTVADAIGAVSSQPTAPPKQEPPAAQARSAARKTPSEGAPATEAPADVSEAPPRRTKG